MRPRVLLGMGRRLWNSAPALFLLNVLLWASVYLRTANVGEGEWELPLWREDASFEETMAAAFEMFQFMHDQRLGKVQPKPLDFPEQTLWQTSCWMGYPEPPPLQIQEKNQENKWQLVHDSEQGRELYLFNAYIDRRSSPLFPTAHCVVQVLTMVRRLLRDDVYCLLWGTEARRPRIVRAFYREIWQRAWDPRNRFYTPWLLSCPVPADSPVPASVSLAWKPCPSALSSRLPILSPCQVWRCRWATVWGEGLSVCEEKGFLVVCVKGLDTERDESRRLAEWLEATFLLGADTILIYTYSIHPNTARLLRGYERLRLSLPGAAPTIPQIRSRYIWRNRQQKRRNEIIPYNDCLYRHLHTHRYLLIIDTDEIIVPKPPLNNYAELLSLLERENGYYSAFTAPNAFFFPNLTRQPDPTIPEELFMTRHDVRSRRLSPAGSYGKSLVNVSAASTVFNHFPLHLQRPGLLRTHYVPPKQAVKHHYKETCPVESRDECPALYSHTLTDRSLLRFRDQLQPRVQAILSDIFGQES